MTSSMLLPFLVAFGVGYLFGSVPFGLLLTKAAGHGDVRSIGSGSIGATNVLRTGNKKLAAATLLLDGFKGYLAVVFVGMFLAPMLLPGTPVDAAAAALAKAGAGDPLIATMHFRLSQIWSLMTAAGLGAFIGHIYPVWLGFRGGKGVATYIGVLMGLAWKIGLMFCGIWLVMAVLFRYSSLAALFASAAVPVLIFWLGTAHFAVVAGMMTGLLFWAHRENIKRLMSGTESKIGAKSKQVNETAE